jgi:uncharacterized membrane protein
LILGVLVVSVFGLGTLGGVTFARSLQPQDDPFATPERIFLETFSRDFKLSPRQRQQLRIVLEEKERQKRELLEEHLRSLPVARRTRFRQADRDADRRIYAILNADQRDLYRDQLDQQGQARRELRMP